MKFKVYADTHIFSPIEICREEVNNEPAAVNTLFIGDIIDLANVAKNQVETARAAFRFLDMKHGDNYICGNHSRMTTQNEAIMRTTESGTRIIFVHGDIEANPTKWRQYRAQPHGASAFKRKFVIPFIKEAEAIIDRKLKPEVLDNIVKLCESYNCNVYVCGHYHPETVQEINYKGKRIIILKRGLNEIEII
jgi:UDP-2,3-diacylglucosamine pyrophosphatase LpxH